MKRFVEGEDRTQSVLFPERLDDYIDDENPVRVIDAFVDELNLVALGFEGTQPAATGRPAYRQNVQRIVNDLLADRLVELQPNPHHRRAQLVVLTPAGTRAFEGAMQLQAPWINGLARGLDVNDIETTHATVTAIRRRLEAERDSSDPA